jgi:hypothetical protein
MDTPEKVAQQEPEQERAAKPGNTPSEGNQPPFQGDVVRTASVEDQEKTDDSEDADWESPPFVFEDRSSGALLTA